jgi:hypothetical protein
MIVALLKHLLRWLAFQRVACRCENVVRFLRFDSMCQGTVDAKLTPVSMGIVENEPRDQGLHRVHPGQLLLPRHAGFSENRKNVMAITAIGREPI